MANLSKANQVRRDKAINKLYNFSDHGVKSFKNLIDDGLFMKSEAEKIPQLQYNRTKFNRMTNQYGEQDEYYRKCTEKTKQSYSLIYKELWKGKHEVSTTVSKFVFDYYNDSNPVIKDQTQEATEAEMKHLFNL